MPSPGAPSLFDESFLRQLDRLSLLTRRARAGQLQGERRSPKRGQAVEFADYRDYVAGDDLRSVDWNVYARLERLFVKLSVEEQDTTVHVLLDSSQSMAYGEPAKWPYALRLAGAIGYLALAGTDRLVAAALECAGLRRLPPLRGKRQALAWFEWLQTGQAAGEATLGAALRRYAETAPRGGIAVLISDLLDPTWQEGLAALADQRFELTLLQVLAPQELNPALDGDLKLVDSETGQAVEITADFDLLVRYRAHLSAWQDEVRAFCARRDANYVLVDTALPIETLLLTYLRERAVIR